MKLAISSKLYPNKKISITMPESPVLLRLNKQVGCFASGLIEKHNRESMQTYGRGTWLECAIAKFDDDLHGIVGIGESKQWGFVSAIVIKAEDARVQVGSIVHFLTYGAERVSCARLEHENTRKVPYILRINFNLSIPTQHGTTIKPPSISTRKAIQQELRYLGAARIIVKDYPNYFPDAIDLYPAKYHAQTNKLTSGLVHLKSSTVSKVRDNNNAIPLKTFSRLFWRAD